MAAVVKGYNYIICLIEITRTYTCINPYNYRKNKGQVQCSPQAPQRGKNLFITGYTLKMSVYK